MQRNRSALSASHVITADLFFFRWHFLSLEFGFYMRFSNIVMRFFIHFYSLVNATFLFLFKRIILSFH